MAVIEYDQSRLTTPLDKARSTRVACIGGGSIGSFFAMGCVMMGIEHIAVLDMDSYSPTNPTKSFVITPEDIGQNKAHALVKKLRAFNPRGCFCGAAASAGDTGPVALHGFDYIALCVDNYKAKYWVNCLWKQLPLRPDGTHPRLILTGTDREMGQAMLLDGTEGCLECFLGPEDDYGQVRRECGAAYRQAVQSGHVPTSGEAGARSAMRALELLRRDLLGDREDNNLLFRDTGRGELEKMPFMQPAFCDACNITPPEEILWLSGSTRTVTAGSFWTQAAARLDRQDFTVLGVRQIILREHCRGCGQPLDYVGGVNRVAEAQLLCPHCTESRMDWRTAPPALSCSSITGANLRRLADRSLFALGYDVGGFIPVRSGSQYVYFAFLDDAQVLHQNIDEEW